MTTATISTSTALAAATAPPPKPKTAKSAAKKPAKTAPHSGTVCSGDLRRAIAATAFCAKDAIPGGLYSPGTPTAGEFFHLASKGDGNAIVEFCDGQMLARAMIDCECEGKFAAFLPVAHGAEKTGLRKLAPLLPDDSALEIRPNAKKDAAEILLHETLKTPEGEPANTTPIQNFRARLQMGDPKERITAISADANAKPLAADIIIQNPRKLLAALAICAKALDLNSIDSYRQCIVAEFTANALTLYGGSGNLYHRFTFPISTTLKKPHIAFFAPEVWAGIADSIGPDNPLALSLLPNSARAKQESPNTLEYHTTHRDADTPEKKEAGKKLADLFTRADKTPDWQVIIPAAEIARMTLATYRDSSDNLHGSATFVFAEDGQHRITLEIPAKGDGKKHEFERTFSANYSGENGGDTREIYLEDECVKALIAFAAAAPEDAIHLTAHGNVLHCMTPEPDEKREIPAAEHRLVMSYSRA